jgi:succinylglutamate desuccinylase
MAKQPNIAQTGFFLKDTSKKFIKKIQNEKRYIIDHVSSLGYEVYGDTSLQEWLTSNTNVAFYRIDNSQKQKALVNYPTPEQIEDKLLTLAEKNPNIFKLFSIGKTKQGRELWVMKVSDNVEVDELEPEFKYVANMHGDEIVGRELMVSLLEEIAQKYNDFDKEILTLVNNTEIYIMPSLNPDGAARRRRGNSNWRDLNRDFPDYERDSKNFSINARERQLETVAMMNFQAERNFSLSANFHGGTEVVNYPWDTTAEDFPLLNLVKALSTDYAAIIPSMRDNNEFTNGIVNGYAWYEINGGMQDWSYHWHNDLQVTIELSHSKWPSYDRVPSYYEKNRRSLINYMKKVHQGIGVKFNTKSKGTITYRKLDGSQYKHFISSDFDNSEFYKILEAGSYQVEVSIDNQDPITFYQEVSPTKINDNGNFKTIEL